MLTKNEEKVLKYLISKLETSKLSAPNRVMIGIGQYEFCGLSSKETISIIKTLHESGYISATFRPHEDGSSPCIIDLKEAGLNYEIHKREEKAKNRRRNIRDVIFLLIGAFFKELFSLIHDLLPTLINMIKNR